MSAREKKIEQLSKQVKSLRENLMRMVLKLDTSRKIFETILENPMSTKEIREIVKMDKAQCSDDLRTLEANGLIVFQDDKWLATNDGKEVYAKYYD